MKARVAILFCFISFHLSAQSLVKQWDSRFGGSLLDNVITTKKTHNGGLVLCGYSFSGATGDKTEPNWDTTLHSTDIWVVLMDSMGNKLWDKTLGGSASDYVGDLMQLSDGGFFILGGTNSPVSGDVSQPSFDTIPYDYFGDGWLVRIDSNGNKLWDKRYGGIYADALISIVQTGDGNYLLGGWSYSPASGNKTSGNKRMEDYWIIKIDSAGNILWDKDYGGDLDDEFNNVIPTFDHGFLLAGSSNTGISGDKTQDNWDTTYSTSDYWIVKIDSAGNKLWDKRFGGTDWDVLFGCAQSSDSGFVLSGESMSQPGGNKTAPLLGTEDYWVVKIDKLGNKLWDKKYGGLGNNGGGLISKTTTDGFLLAGTSDAGVSGDKTEANLAGFTEWIVNIDSAGNKIWDKTLQIQGSLTGGTLAPCIETYSNCYYFICSPVADVGGDKSQDSRGQNDYWISKWVYTAPSPVAAFQANDTVFCANDCINFSNMSTNATSWQWSFVGGDPDTSTLQSPQGICYANEGTYNVMLIVSNSSDSDTLTLSNYITVHPAPVTPFINQVSNTLYCTTSPSYISYQWYYDSAAIQNATDTFYVATQSGNYNVEVKDENGCTVGAGIDVTVGIEQFTINGLQFTVSPNPASDELNIISYSLLEKGTITIFNVLGEIIYTEQFNTKHETINCKPFPSGVYFVQLTDETHSFVSKFVKE